MPDLAPSRPLRLVTLLAGADRTLHQVDGGAGPAPEVRACTTPAELHARLRLGERPDAVVVDARRADVDRDLLALVAARRVPCVVVAGARDEPRWLALGASAVVAPSPTACLVDAVRRLDLGEADGPDATGWAASAPCRHRVVAVLGPPGQGATTVAAHLAAGLAERAARCGPHPGDACIPVLVADLARHAEQAAVHGLPAGLPGVLELVDAHRHGTPTTAEVRRLTVAVDAGHRVLPGLPHPGDWLRLGAASVDAALTSLRAATAWLVADLTADLEDEATTGSTDIEDRNRLALATLPTADLVVVVGASGPLGRARRDAVVHEVRRLGVDQARVVVVTTDRTGARGEAASPAALAHLAVARAAPLPPRTPTDAADLRPVVAGSLGCWADRP